MTPGEVDGEDADRVFTGDEVARGDGARPAKAGEVAVEAEGAEG